jgi:hypothetical protein
MGEAAQLQVDDDQAAQATVEEEQIYAIPFVVDSQAALAADEGEIIAQFEKKGFQVADESVFEVGLGVFVA